MLHDPAYMRYLEWKIHGDRKWNGNDPELGGGQNGELLFNERKVSVWDNEKVLEMYSGDSRTAL